MGRIYETYVKRALDVALSGCALAVLSPVMGVTALLVRQKLGSPVIFCQDRPGKDEQIFRLYKFRTMTDARGADGELLPDAQRLTPFGRRLRSTSLDELPELWDIFRGKMSIVGPRPLLVKYLPYYTETERHRYDVRPGLTGLAQINGRNCVSWEEKFSYDLQYVSAVSLLGDIKILLRTVVVALSHSGIKLNAQEDFDVYRSREHGANIQVNGTCIK